MEILWQKRYITPMHDEGVVKYHSTWQQSSPGSDWDITGLNTCRKWLFDHGFIGINEEGIGYGNVSQRYRDDQFIITGSATGHLPELTESHYCLVTSCDAVGNRLVCVGPIQASSESLSHSVIYRLNREIGTVLHVHHRLMWHQYIDKVPTTGRNVPYGTPEMVVEIQRLYHETDLPVSRFLIMGGHFEGIIIFGHTLDDALAGLKTRLESMDSLIV